MVLDVPRVRIYGCRVMSCSSRWRAIALLATSAFALSFATAPAAAASRYCQRVEAGGNIFPVHVDRGKVSCRTARRIVVTAIESVRCPVGWRCVFPRRDPAFALRCSRGPKSKPRDLIRASPHL